jgi:hypothetical protein
VKYDWYDLSIGELHSSKIKQKWHSYKGTWMMDSEVLDEGSPGLLGEKVADEAAPATPRTTQFPSVRLGD